MSEIGKSVHADMLVRASDTGPEAYIGRVVGLKQGRYIKLSKHDTPDGKRRYIPLLWVKAVRGHTVQLTKTAAVVRRTWLDKAGVKDQASDD